MSSQRKFLITGLLFSIIFIVRLVQLFLTGNVSIVELFNWASLVYMAFAIAHLYPQFQSKDERMEAIRQKGMYITVFIILVALIALMVLIQFNIFTFTTLEFIRVMISLVIITIWTCWIILSKEM